MVKVEIETEGCRGELRVPGKAGIPPSDDASEGHTMYWMRGATMIAGVFWGQETANRSTEPALILRRRK